MDIFTPQRAYRKILATETGNFDTNARMKSVDDVGIRRGLVPKKRCRANAIDSLGWRTNDFASLKRSGLRFPGGSRELLPIGQRWRDGGLVKRRRRW